LHSWREMKDTKTLNVSRGIHKDVKKAALDADCLLGDYTDALILVGLRHRDEVMQLVEERTKKEPEPGPA
jgi:hypothetical protein